MQSVLKDEKLPVHKSHPIRMKIYTIGIELKPISRTRVQVRAIICIDPLLKGVVHSLYVFILK